MELIKIKGKNKMGCIVCNKEVEGDEKEGICSDCVQRWFGFEVVETPSFKQVKEEPEKITLPKNGFYLLVSNYSYCLKTKSEKEFDRWEECQGVVFTDTVENSEILDYRIGEITKYKIGIAKLIESKRREDGLSDMDTLRTPVGSTIKEVRISR